MRLEIGMTARAEKSRACRSKIENVNEMNGRVVGTWQNGAYGDRIERMLLLKPLLACIQCTNCPNSSLLPSAVCRHGNESN